MKYQGYNLVLKFFMTGDYEVCHLFYPSFPFSCSPFLPSPFLCLCSPGWPGTDLVVQVGLKLLIFFFFCLGLSNSRIPGMSRLTHPCAYS